MKRFAIHLYMVNPRTNRGKQVTVHSVTEHNPSGDHEGWKAECQKELEVWRDANNMTRELGGTLTTIEQLR